LFKGLAARLCFFVLSQLPVDHKAAFLIVYIISLNLREQLSGLKMLIKISHDQWDSIHIRIQTIWRCIVKKEKTNKRRGAGRRSQAIALTRIAFGLVWSVDAYFKWQPAFADNFVGYLKETFDGQPALIQTWLNFWIKLVSIDPHLFARIVALSETGIAVGLLLGLFSNLAYAGGVILSLVIWAVPEGFGGPYAPGATDIGAGIIYIFGFLGLFLLSAGQHYGLDRILWERLGRWQFLSSTPPEGRNS
jgi:uncharacterized membrane protein YphA (DoxX/SURF4 family)